MQHIFMPALVGKLTGNDVGKGRSEAYDKSKKGHFVGFKPFMIADSAVHYDRRYPRNAECQQKNIE